MATPILSIREYCVKYGLIETAGLIPHGQSSSNVKLEELFDEKETKKANDDLMKSLGIVFKGNAERDDLRKRIRNRARQFVRESRKNFNLTPSDDLYLNRCILNC